MGRVGTINTYAIYGKRDKRKDVCIGYIDANNSKEALKQAKIEYRDSGWTVTSVVLKQEG